MLEAVYWITGILATVIFSYIAYKAVTKIKNVRIVQTAEALDNTKGVDVVLDDGKDLNMRNVDITQDARRMNNVTGLAVKAEGKQSMRLQGVRIKQPGVEIIISDDPNVRVEINKQD